MYSQFLTVSHFIFILMHWTRFCLSFNSDFRSHYNPMPIFFLKINAANHVKKERKNEILKIFFFDNFSVA